MNAIKKALDEIRYNIPRTILEEAFISQQLRGRGLAVSLDTKIRELVLDPRVLVDCDIVGGVEITIDLSQLMPELVNPGVALYRIPKSLTQGRSITSALSLSFGRGAATGIGGYSNNNSALLGAVQGVLDSALPIPVVAIGDVSLVGENTVMVSDQYVIGGDVWLRCLVSNDPELNNISPASYHNFCELSVLAVKAYIFNHLIIPMDEGQLHAGMQLGRFREIVDGYADANELYREFLNEKWRVTAFHNDPERHRRHLKLILGGNY